MRGFSIVAGILFMAIVFTGVVFIYVSSLPILKKMQCTSNLEQAKNTFVQLDNIIGNIIKEGSGSKRIINLFFSSGNMELNTINDYLKWSDECEYKIIAPRTYKMFGNLLIGSGLNVKAYRGTCLGTDSYIIENEIIKACFKVIGDGNKYEEFYTKDIIVGIYNKKLKEWMPMKYIDISVDSNSTSKHAYGYTKLITQGYTLPYGEVLVFIDSDYIPYKIRFYLESGADFIIIRGE